ncbi:MAG: hypothetical protein ISS11_08495 [Candidatus Marinimicrobia bacterium]|nr:hypothetical protein [Candidatus Neomarinimicrobiota bacterium]
MEEDNSFYCFNDPSEMGLFKCPKCGDEMVISLDNIDICGGLDSYSIECNNDDDFGLMDLQFSFYFQEEIEKYNKIRREQSCEEFHTDSKCLSEKTVTENKM